MPVPLDYTGQKVVGFRVQAQPATNLRSWRWRVEGLNRYVEVELADTTPTTVTWDANVLAPIETVVRTQDKNFSLWKGWSPLVAKDAKTGRDAKRFRNDNEPHEAIARWTAGRLLASTAGSTSKAALKQGGDPLGRAALCAAMLRSNKVGARLVQYVSTVGAFAGPGWMTEGQTTTGRWQEVEPYIGLTVPERNSFAVMDIVALSDEAIPAPFKSVPWVSAGAVEAYTLSGKPLTGFPAPAAGRVLSSAYIRAEKVAVAASKSESVWDEESVLLQAAKAGLLPFCRLMDGQS